MNLADEFISFLEVHPELYPISKSSLYIDFLNCLRQRAKTISQFCSLFPDVDEKDVELIVFSLQKLGLASKVMAGREIFYYLSSLGKTFMEKYDLAKTELTKP